MAYNTIYERLTADPNDLQGALAYIIYKKHKVDFYKSHTGGGPSQEEIESFHAIASLQTSLDLYRSQAEALVANFLNLALDEISERTANETRQDILYKHIGDVSVGLQTQLTTINDSLGAKRTLLGWLRDVSGNITVNIVTVIIIGAILIGTNALGDLQKAIEQKVGLGGQSAQVPAQPGKPHTP